jgi:hypothetical protein
MDGLPIAKLLSQAIRKMHPVFHLMAATPKGQTWHNLYNIGVRSDHLLKIRVTCMRP